MRRSASGINEPLGPERKISNTVLLECGGVWWTSNNLLINIVAFSGTVGQYINAYDSVVHCSICDREGPCYEHAAYAPKAVFNVDLEKYPPN